MYKTVSLIAFAVLGIPPAYAMGKAKPPEVISQTLTQIPVVQAKACNTSCSRLSKMEVAGDYFAQHPSGPPRMNASGSLFAYGGEYCTLTYGNLGDLTHLTHLNLFDYSDSENPYCLGDRRIFPIFPEVVPSPSGRYLAISSGTASGWTVFGVNAWTVYDLEAKGFLPPPRLTSYFPYLGGEGTGFHIANDYEVHMDWSQTDAGIFLSNGESRYIDYLFTLWDLGKQKLGEPNYTLGKILGYDSNGHAYSWTSKHCSHSDQSGEVCCPSNGQINKWDTTTSQEVATLSDNSQWKEAQFSSLSQRAALITQDQALKVIDLNSETILSTWTESSGQTDNTTVHCLAMAPKGNMVAYLISNTSGSSQLIVADSSGNKIATSDSSQNLTCRGLILDSDSRTVALFSEEDGSGAPTLTYWKF